MKSKIHLIVKDFHPFSSQREESAMENDPSFLFKPFKIGAEEERFEEEEIH